jgi:hypothetical protein
MHTGCTPEADLLEAHAAKNEAQCVGPSIDSDQVHAAEQIGSEVCTLVASTSAAM